VIATFELTEWLKTQGVAGATGGNHGGTVAFEGGTAKFVPAWHTSSYFDGTTFVAPGSRPGWSSASAAARSTSPATPASSATWR
jgi:L-ascorbate metabolism protein UlaG (beta-lactamase superfamily)